MAPEGETEQSEMPDKTYVEPHDSFEAKKLMKEYDDGRWMEDPAKIRGAILQWAKSDSLVLAKAGTPNLKELYLAWDYWMASKLSYSWLLLKTRGSDKKRIHRYFVDYLDENENVKNMAEKRSQVIEGRTSVEHKLYTHFKTDAEVDLVSTEEEDELNESVYHVDRDSGDSKLRHQVDLEPTDVPRAGIDIEGEELLGYSIVGYYTVEGIPCFIVDDGDDTYEIPLHYLADDDN